MVFFRSCFSYWQIKSAKPRAIRLNIFLLPWSTFLMRRMPFKFKNDNILWVICDFIDFIIFFASVLLFLCVRVCVWTTNNTNLPRAKCLRLVLDWDHSSDVTLTLLADLTVSICKYKHMIAICVSSCRLLHGSVEWQYWLDHCQGSFGLQVSRHCLPEPPPRLEMIRENCRGSNSYQTHYHISLGFALHIREKTRLNMWASTEGAHSAVQNMWVYCFTQSSEQAETQSCVASHTVKENISRKYQ